MRRVHQGAKGHLAANGWRTRRGDFGPTSTGTGIRSSGGDLCRQGRELAVIRTTEKETLVPNYSMTWGAQVFKGNIYSSDFNSGLWVTRLVEPQVLP